MNSDSISFCQKTMYDNLPTTCVISSCSPTSCTTQPSVSLDQLEHSTRDAASPLYLIPPANPPDPSRSPTISSDLNLMNASPPELCSSPPIFKPPPLPHTQTTVPSANQPLVGRLPLSSVIHPALMNTTVGTTGTVSGPVPSTFPSPGSAFTELHPRSGTASHPRGCPFPSVTSDEHSTPTVAQSKPNLAKTTGVQVNTSSGGSSHSSSHSSAPSPIQYDALSSSASSARSFTCVAVYCRLCGQSHDPTSSHRYNYTQAVDADLCCSLCHQPLVEPLDTKCGHTFCTPCLKNHLAIQALCPVDRQIINYLECQQASNIVKRLLDKLLVSCPNTRFCETVLYRASLEEHVRDWCPGTFLPCENAPYGCSYEGPRVTHTQHRWRCPFQSGSTALFQPITAVRPSLGPYSTSAPGRSQPSQTSANSYPGTPLRFPQSVCRASGSTSTVPGATQSPAFFSPLPQHLTDRLRSLAFKPKLPEIEETYDCPTIYEGSPVSVVIRRSANCCDLGFTFVGGADTPLSCILIQEIYLDGSVALDGRLRPGDQILEVNGQMVIEATHSETRRLLSYPTPLVQLTVYRESLDPATRHSAALPHTHGEVFHVNLCKRQGKVLGIKLVGKKHLPGLYVLELVPGCEAQLDGRLEKDDQILEINGIDLSDGTQEQAAHIINTATESVTFKVARRHRDDTPDILRIANGSNEQLQMFSSFRALRLNSSDATSSTPNVSDPVTRTDRSRRVGSRSQQSNRSLCSPVMSSIATDSSSLKAFHVPSRASELISSSLSSSTEPFTVSKSTSQLLVDEEDRASSGTKEVTLTTGSTSPQCVERSVRHAPISATPQYPTCEERNVLVKKAPNEPLGISVAGGRHSQRGDTPVYVTNISPDCVLGRDKLVKRGDVLLEVNGIGLVGLTHNEAVNVIRRASSMRSRVDLRLIDAPETGEGPNNFMPSWTFWLQLPPICQLARTVRLVRNVVSSSSSSSGRLEPLGFTIVGGLGDGGPRPRPLLETEPATTDQTVSPERRRWGGYTSLYPCPIVIKSIVPGFLAARDGRLKCGDLILAVNNVSMLNIPHASAVRLLKQLQGDVALQIISWPGTIV